MATIKVTYIDDDLNETTEEKETELTVKEFSRNGYALVQTLCRLLKSAGKIE